MDFKIFKNKNFSLYIIGKLVSILGSNIQQFALSLYVFALTGSTTLFATMISLSVLPRILLSPIAGVFGDWFDRKKMIVGLDFFNGFFLIALALLYYLNNGISVVMIVGIIIILEMVEIFYGSSTAGVLPSIVKKDDIAKAKSAFTLVNSSARILSPIIAAALFGFYGLFIILLFNGLTFILCALAEMFMKVPKLHKKPETMNIKSFFTDLTEGLNLIRQNSFISSLIYLATAVNFIVGPLLYIGFIYLIMDVLQGSEVQYGLFNTIIAISMLCAPIFGAKVIQNGDVRKICVYGIGLISIIFMIMSIVPSTFVLERVSTNTIPFVILMVLAFFIGLIVTITNISISTLFVKVVPVQALGRTSTVMNLLITISLPIGQIFMGFLLDTLATSYVIIISGMSMLVVVLLLKNTMLNSSIETAKLSEETIDQKRGLAHEV